MLACSEFLCQRKLIPWYLQMTGLDPDHDRVMSVSCFITDSQLNILDSAGWDAVIHHDKVFLDAMGDWCTKTHGDSGLTAASIESKRTPEQAADGLLDYIQNLISKPGRGLLAGNSVHCDKAFLVKPPYAKVIEYLHYRILDVSSLKEAARRWATDEDLQQIAPKKTLHQARADILESIEEAKYYRDTFFKKTAN